MGKKSLRDIGRKHAEKKRKAIKMPEPGEVFEGYCGGEFGRDSYGEKRVVAAGQYNGNVWIVVEEGGHLVTAITDLAEVQRWRDDMVVAEREREEWDRYEASTEGDR